MCIRDRVTNAIYKGMIWTQNHSSEEIAKSVKPQFPDTDDDVLIALINRYSCLLYTSEYSEATFSKHCLKKPFSLWAFFS